MGSVGHKAAEYCREGVEAADGAINSVVEVVARGMSTGLEKLGVRVHYSVLADAILIAVPVGVAFMIGRHTRRP